MATAPPIITALPTPPDPNDRATFNTRAYPWSVAQQTLATEVGAVAANVFSNATEATEAAALAVPAAAAAEAASNAALWVSGTTYAAGVVVWSPINALSYRRKTAGAGTTDPSADSANWAALAGGSPSLARSARTSNTILGTADKGKLIDITSGTFSQTFDAAATLGDGWYCYLRNSGTGDITLDPNAAETIDGAATKIIQTGEVLIVQCDGVALRALQLTPSTPKQISAQTVSTPVDSVVFSSLPAGADVTYLLAFNAVQHNSGSNQIARFNGVNLTSSGVASGSAVRGYVILRMGQGGSALLMSGPLAHGAQVSYVTSLLAGVSSITISFDGGQVSAGTLTLYRVA